MHFIQPTQIWLSFRAKNLRVTSHETLLQYIGKKLKTASLNSRFAGSKKEVYFDLLTVENF